jgi:hypothetical protein
MKIERSASGPRWKALIGPTTAKLPRQAVKARGSSDCISADGRDDGHCSVLVDRGLPSVVTSCTEPSINAMAQASALRPSARHRGLGNRGCQTKLLPTRLRPAPMELALKYRSSELFGARPRFGPSRGGLHRGQTGRAKRRESLFSDTQSRMLCREHICEQMLIPPRRARFQGVPIRAPARAPRSRRDRPTKLYGTWK